MLRFTDITGDGWVGVLLGFQQFWQSSAQHCSDLEWNEIDYYMQVRQLSLDVLNYVRDEIQDIYERDERTLDTRLLVVTLMLGFGFGFVVEGTFPMNHDDEDQEHHGLTNQKIARLFYVVLLSCSIILPFMSLCGFLVCRHRLNIFMKWFNDYFFKKIEHEFQEAKASIGGGADSISAKTRNTTTGLPSSAWGCCLKRRQMPPLLQSWDRSKASLHTKTVGLTELNHVKAHYINYKRKWVQSITIRSRYCMILGVSANVLCATFLLGMYFQSKYEDPIVFRLYCACMSVGFATASLSWCWLQCHEPSMKDVSECLLG